MGADLITCALAHKNEAELDFDAGRGIVRTTAIEDFPEEPFHWVEDDEELRDVYLKAIDMVEDALEGSGYYRSINSYYIQGHWLYIIGGTSYGDDPSDLFACANSLACWPELLEAINFETDWGMP